MRQALQELERPDLLPRDRMDLEQRIRADLTVLWQTAFIRAEKKPTVMDEVARGLSITPRLLEVVPRVYEALRDALKTYYPSDTLRFLYFSGLALGWVVIVMATRM